MTYQISSLLRTTPRRRAARNFKHYLKSIIVARQTTLRKLDALRRY